MSSRVVDEAVLDDPSALEAGDPDQMLRVVAGSGAQVREALRQARESGVDALAGDDRPRSLVITGMGGSAIGGDLLAAVIGDRCPIPVVVHRGYGLPGWVGPMDLVIGTSCSGGTEETLSAVTEAIRRGSRLVTVGKDNSELAELSTQARGIHISVDAAGRQPRASLWLLCVPMLVVAETLGLATIGDDVFAATADRLDDLAVRCRPASETFVNPGKSLALELSETMPMVWGSGQVGPVAATRMVCQLAENAKYPGIPGVLPEANHNQVVTFDGPWAGRDDDLFRDRGDDVPPARLRLVLLHDNAEHPQVRRRREVSRSIAERRGVAVTELGAAAEHPLERIAELTGLIDFGTVYLALGTGVDPTPVGPIDELKARIAT